MDGEVDLIMLEEALNDLEELLRMLEVANLRIMAAIAGIRALIKGYHTLPVALIPSASSYQPSVQAAAV